MCQTCGKPSEIKTVRVDSERPEVFSYEHRCGACDFIYANINSCVPLQQDEDRRTDLAEPVRPAKKRRRAHAI